MKRREVGPSGFKSHGHRSHISGLRRFFGGRNKHWIGDELVKNAKEIMRRIRQQRSRDDTGI